MPSLKLPSNTRANLDARIASNALAEGRIYYITDEDIVFYAVSTNRVVEFGASKGVVVSANRTIRAGQKVIFNTSGAVRTGTLEVAPAEGDIVSIGRVGANNVVIARSAKNIAGLAEDLTLDVDLALVDLGYISGAWRILEARTIV